MRTQEKSFLLLGVLVLSFSGCVANLSLQQGEEAFIGKNWEKAVEYYQKALQADPQNPRIRLSLAKAYLYASNVHYETGESLLKKGEKKLALIEFQKALDIFPENLRARDRKNKLLKEAVVLQEKTREKSELEMAAEKMMKADLTINSLKVDPEKRFDLRLPNSFFFDIVNTLQKIGGINILLDDQVPNKQISIDMANVTFKQALENLVLSNTLYYKIIDSNNIILIPNSPQKRQQYDELIVRTLYPTHLDVKDLAAYLKAITKIDAVSINAALNSVTVRDTVGKVNMAERIIQALDKPRGDVLIDVEIIEVNKQRMKEYGFDLSNYQLAANVVSSNTSLDAGLIQGDEISDLSSANLLFSIPSVILKLMSSDIKSKIIASPQLRVKSKEQGQLKIGDKVPIPQTTWSPIAAGGVASQPIQSFTYENVGINIEITPTIHSDGTITLKTNFELSFITSAGTSTFPPTIGTRTVASVLRLKDGETNLLAGLLREEERKSLIFTITPRILSYPAFTESDLNAFWVGSEYNLGFKSMIPSKEQAKEEEIYDGAPLLLGFVPQQSVVSPNSDFFVDLVLENVSEAKDAVLNVGYDPAVIQAVKIEDSPTQKKGLQILNKSIDNTKGRLLISVSQAKEPAGPSDKILFKIHFKAIKPGNSLLDFSGGKILSHSGVEIPVLYEKGTVVVK
jgi:general secretion pathway protein D